MKKIKIAIDGHSSTGKSTLAKQLAKALNYIYVDTGAMYRAITLFASQNGYFESQILNKTQLIDHLDNISIQFDFDQENQKSNIQLNGINVEDSIRSMAISNKVSEVAKLPEVRSKLVEIQQEMGKNGGIVMDGRDIGSVVFPDAELKLFMTASPEARAKRRYDELNSTEVNISYEEVLTNVITRDKIDSSRKTSPLIQTEDAVLIDNTALSKTEQFEKVLKLAQERIALS